MNQHKGDFLYKESLDPKIGINRPRPFPDIYLNTTKINTKVWIQVFF